MPTFPEWWNWDLSFTSHAELRMEQRGVTEVEVRAMLERATSFEPNVVEGRFMIHVCHAQRPWIAIVERCRREAAHRRDCLRGVRMTERSLQVTYRKGRAFAAYLHLSHPTGEKSAKDFKRRQMDSLLSTTTPQDVRSASRSQPRDRAP